MFWIFRRMHSYRVFHANRAFSYPKFWAVELPGGECNSPLESKWAPIFVLKTFNSSQRGCPLQMGNVIQPQKWIGGKNSESCMSEIFHVAFHTAKINSISGCGAFQPFFSSLLQNVIFVWLFIRLTSFKNYPRRTRLRLKMTKINSRNYLLMVIGRKNSFFM